MAPLRCEDRTMLGNLTLWHLVILAIVVIVVALVVFAIVRLATRGSRRR
jgi:hypothetical protein